MEKGEGKIEKRNKRVKYKEELRQKGHNRSRKMTCRWRGKNNILGKGGKI
jgi:hypothetical protein